MKHGDTQEGCHPRTSIEGQSGIRDSSLTKGLEPTPSGVRPERTRRSDPYHALETRQVSHGSRLDGHGILPVPLPRRQPRREAIRLASKRSPEIQWDQPHRPASLHRPIVYPKSSGNRHAPRVGYRSRRPAQWPTCCRSQGTPMVSRHHHHSRARWPWSWRRPTPGSNASRRAVLLFSGSEDRNNSDQRTTALLPDDALVPPSRDKVAGVGR